MPLRVRRAGIANLAQVVYFANFIKMPRLSTITRSFKISYNLKRSRAVLLLYRRSAIESSFCIWPSNATTTDVGDMVVDVGSAMGRWQYWSSRRRHRYNNNTLNIDDCRRLSDESVWRAAERRNESMGIFGFCTPLSTAVYINNTQ